MNLVDISVLFKTNIKDIYGGRLEAYSFSSKDAHSWFNTFQTHLIGSLGKGFLPIYRMADGEYRFLMGRKPNYHFRHLLKEFLYSILRVLKLVDDENWTTSWGEHYSKDQIDSLRMGLIENIRDISNSGYLSCYFYETGLDKYHEYNSSLLDFFASNDIKVGVDNYYPFHFVGLALTVGKCYDFYLRRKILFVSSLSDMEKDSIKKNVLELGASEVGFLNISSNSSMTDTVDLSTLDTKSYDLVLVAAGIGSAHIISQLSCLNTVTIDIGGLIRVFMNPDYQVHQGSFSFPEVL